MIGYADYVGINALVQVSAVNVVRYASRFWFVYLIERFWRQVCDNLLYIYKKLSKQL